MDSRANVYIALGAALLLGACSSDGGEELPQGCRAAEDELGTALEGAPGPVELGGTRLSGCLVKSSSPAEIQEVGAAYLAVAADLAGAATGRPEGGHALRLGYLVGAAQRGAARTQGIHSELVRRLEQEAAPFAARSQAYARGERAGRRSG
jgi:hypothetical protein